jgi:hypothetical protein
MSDVIDELKRVSRCIFKDGWESADLHARAGIEIAMLRARIAEMQAAAPAPTDSDRIDPKLFRNLHLCEPAPAPRLRGAIEVAASK